MDVVGGPDAWIGSLEAPGISSEDANAILEFAYHLSNEPLHDHLTTSRLMQQTGWTKDQLQVIGEAHASADVEACCVNVMASPNAHGKPMVVYWSSGDLICPCLLGLSPVCLSPQSTLRCFNSWFRLTDPSTCAP